MYFQTIPSPVGLLTMTSDGIHLTELWLEGQRGMSIAGMEEKKLPIFNQVADWLYRYFQKEKPAIKDIPMQFSGTPFQLQVWELLKTIPYGQVVTYGSLAAQLSSRMSAQAVGQAVGHNPIAIIIPCHRVVGKTSLTGYAGGLDKKIALLKLEGVDLSSFA